MKGEATHALWITKYVGGVRRKYFAGFLPQSVDKASLKEQNERACKGEEGGMQYSHLLFNLPL